MAARVAKIGVNVQLVWSARTAQAFGADLAHGSSACYAAHGCSRASEPWRTSIPGEKPAGCGGGWDVPESRNDRLQHLPAKGGGFEEKKDITSFFPLFFKCSHTQ